jgi:hypothetical protein
LKLVEPVKTQLATLVPTKLDAVGGAAALKAAFDQVKSGKEAFVVPGGELPQPNTTGTIEIRQPTASTISVFLMLAVTDGTGNQALDEAEALRDDIKAALVGLQIAGTSSPLLYAGCLIADFDPEAGFLVYAVNFSTTYNVKG